jgi:hypothetical protein
MERDEMPNLFKFRDWVMEHRKIRVHQAEKEAQALVLKQEKIV